MLSQSITFAEIGLFMRPLVISLLSPFLLYLLISGALACREIQSYRRQRKRWIWYKRPLAIQVIAVFISTIGCFLFIAPIETVKGTDISNLSPYSTDLRVLIAMIGVSITLIGGGSLALYRQSLINKEKKEEQSPDSKR